MHPPVAELDGEGGQTCRQIDEMLVVFHLAGIELRKIQRAVNRVLQQKIGNLLADVFGHFPLCLNRRCAQMRRGDEIVEFEQRRLRVRFGLEYIESGSGNFSTLQCIVQIRLVDDPIEYVSLGEG